MKHLKTPTRREEQPVITWDQQKFLAMYKDPPASEIPDYSVVESNNLLLYEEWAEGRPGTEVYGAVLPNIPGRENYEAIKTGNTIIKTVGQDFTAEDYENFFIWPSGNADLITGFVNANTITVKQSNVESPATASNPGAVSGKTNAKIHTHYKSGYSFLFIGDKVYYSDYLLATWTDVLNRSVTNLNDSISTFDEYQDFVFLFNSGKIFKIDTSVSPVEMWSINSPVGYNTITEVPESAVNVYGRRYLTGFNKLTGTGNRTRATSGVIKQQSSPNLINPDNENRDYAEVWTPYSIEESGSGTYETLVCGATPASINDFKTWPYTYGEFLASLNGASTRVVSINTLSTISSYQDIAQAIQDALRFTFSAYAPNAICYFDTDHFVMYSSQTSGDTIDFITSTGFAEDISAYINGNTPNATIEDVQSKNIIGPLELTNNEQHFTHYTIHSTKNIKDTANNPEIYTWNNDIPIAKAYDCYRDNADGHLHIVSGTEFDIGDVGSQIKFANGLTDTIGNWISGLEVEGAGVLISIAGQGAAIGGGRVFTASQVGNIVTRDVSGTNTFEPGDVRKTLFWAEDGGYGYVLEFINQDSVRVADSTTRAAQGLTIDPQSRMYNDVISDDILGYRFDSGKYALPNRFWEPLPIVNIGVICPGFMFVALRNDSIIYYSQMPLGLEYLTGYYNPVYQSHPTKDSITSLEEYPDQMIILCTTSIRRVETNRSTSVEVQQAGEFVATITGIAIVDSVVGVTDFGSIQDLELGKQIFITSEPGVRTFNGYQLSENYAIDSKGKGHVSKDLKKLQAAVASGYDEKLGYIIWGSDEEPD